MSPRLFMVIGLVLLTIGWTRADEEFKVEPGFTRLDNGQDLAGWYPSTWAGRDTGDADGWSVVDGAIHLDVEKAKSHLFSRRKFGPSAVIRLQYRADKEADSGLCLHGKQFQVRDYPNSYPETRKYAPHSRPHGQWNDLELDITDGVAVIALNGRVIEKSWNLGDDLDRGLGLQREAGNFDFRFIRIKER